MGERELVLVVSVRCGKERDMTRGWQLFWGHKDVQSWALQLLSHACSRDDVWSCYATLYVLYLWVCCSHSPSDGWKFFSRELKPVLTLRKKFTSRQGSENAENSNCSSSTGFGPTLTTMTNLFGSWPAILTKLSAGFPATVCRTSSLFLLSFSLSYLLTARNVSVFLLGSCQVLVVAIVCILFSLEQCRVVDSVVAEFLRQHLL